MYRECQTVLGAGPADESIMRLSIDETKCTHVLCKRSRADVRQSGLINSMRAHSSAPTGYTKSTVLRHRRPFQRKKTGAQDH